MSSIAKFEKVSLKAWLDFFARYNPGVKMPESDRKQLTEFWENIKLPTRGTVGSAGYDFYSPIPAGPLAPTISQLIPSGIKCKIDPGWVLLVVPKSRHFTHRINLDCTIGVIDSDYYNSDSTEGMIMLCINNGMTMKPKINPITKQPTINKEDIFYCEPGEPIMQGIFVQYGTAEEEDVTNIRTGGFGSTDKPAQDKKSSSIIT